LDQHDDRGLQEDQRGEFFQNHCEGNKEEKSVTKEIKSSNGTVVDMGLDISSSVTGVVLLDTNGNLLFMGHVSLPSTKYKNLFEKADATIDWIKTNLPQDIKIRRIFVEQNAKGYSAGFSSADTLFILAKINVLVSYLVHKQYGAEVIDVHVTSARSMLGFKNKKAVKIPVKEKVRDFILTAYPHLPFETRVVKVGKKKGQLVPAEGIADEIDAFVIAKGGQLLNP
jgi:hypothetical protein